MNLVRIFPRGAVEHGARQPPLTCAPSPEKIVQMGRREQGARRKLDLEGVGQGEPGRSPGVGGAQRGSAAQLLRHLAIPDITDTEPEVEAVLGLPSGVGPSGICLAALGEFDAQKRLVLHRPAVTGVGEMEPDRAVGPGDSGTARRRPQVDAVGGRMADQIRFRKGTERHGQSERKGDGNTEPPLMLDTGDSQVLG